MFGIGPSSGFLPSGLNQGKQYQSGGYDGSGISAGYGSVYGPSSGSSFLPNVGQQRQPYDINTGGYGYQPQPMPKMNMSDNTGISGGYGKYYGPSTGGTWNQPGQQGGIGPQFDIRELLKRLGGGFSGGINFNPPGGMSYLMQQPQMGLTQDSGKQLMDQGSMSPSMDVLRNLQTNFRF